MGKRDPGKNAKYYRWGRRIVCIQHCPDSELGERLIVPKWSLVDLPVSVLKHYPSLPKIWRRRIQESIREREEAVN